MDTICQFLSEDQGSYDMYKCLNGDHTKENKIYKVKDYAHDNFFHKAITLETFKDMKFDIIMPTYPGHDVSWKRLRDLYQPKASLIAQLGNTGQTTICDHVLSSVPYINTESKNVVFYHQELDPNFYFVDDPLPTPHITSVVNLFPYPEIYNKYKSLVPEATWRYHGANCPDGSLSGPRNVSRVMRESMVGWHLKPQGGLGHSAMGWFACGRPLVTDMTDHKEWGSTSFTLFRPGETCIDLSQRNEVGNTKLIRELLNPEVFATWSKRCRKVFDEVINYDEEEQRIRSFLEVALT